jgi:glutathione S-transferase
MSKKRSYLRGFDFPNLPYLFVPASPDGRHPETRLTQSMAILKWLGRRHDLVPHNERECIDADLFVEQARDLCEAITEYAYYPAHRQKVRLGRILRNYFMLLVLCCTVHFLGP